MPRDARDAQDSRALPAQKIGDLASETSRVWARNGRPSATIDDREQELSLWK